MNQEQPHTLNIKIPCNAVMLTFISKPKAILIVFPKCCYAQPVFRNPSLTVLRVLTHVEHFLRLLPPISFCSVP